MTPAFVIGAYALLAGVTLILLNLRVRKRRRAAVPL